jgi:hypothetical protein
MPCTDGGPSYSNDPEIKRRLDLATRLLCFLVDRIDGQELDRIHREDRATSSELAAWIVDHKRADARRIAREKARAAEDDARKLRAAEIALKALSAEQRKKLGL